MMNLTNFERYIDRKIYLRGAEYYEDNCVVSIEETEENVFEAEVEGSDTYTVEVELDDDGNIVDASCDCPYDLGEYCKHQVAVFLALRDMKNNVSSNPAAKKNKKNKKNDLKQVLMNRTKEELIDFLLKIAKESEEMEQRLLLEFAVGSDKEEIKKAVALIRSYINSKSDHFGYVAYEDTYDAMYGAELVLEKADSAFRQNKNAHAVNLVLCVVREIVDLFEFTDDSDGEIGDIIERGFSLIDDIIENSKMKASEKACIFESLMEEAQNKRYDGWSDWRLNYFELCSKIADTPELRERLDNMMDIATRNEDTGFRRSSYFEENICMIRYKMVLQYDGKQKAQEFMEQNLHFYTFRKMAIEKAMERKDYNRVIRLALDGEEKDKDYSGLVDGWRKYRYRAYQLSGMLDEQRQMAMDFILNGSFDYYKELKRTYKKAEWAAIYPKIIAQLEERKRNRPSVYTSILIEENEKEKLLEYVKTNPYLVESYYKHLIPEYKEEVYALFLKHIELAASLANNRRDYQRVCAIIRNLKKAGGSQQASEIKQKLSAKYKNRPAFRDELGKV